jgi:RNA polymerase sigma factor (sigma-70 family)
MRHALVVQPDFPGSAADRPDLVEGAGPSAGTVGLVSTQRDVTVGGIRMVYRVTGAPDAPPMVLLHALGEQNTSWAPVTAPLAERFRVFALDLRGHGQSDWPGTYSFELIRDDVVGVLDQLALDKITLVGHSMGGAVAYLIAGEQPGRIERLIVEDVPPPFPRDRAIPPRPAGPLDFDWAAAPAIIGQVNKGDQAAWERLRDITAPTLLIGGGPRSHIPEFASAVLAWLPAHRRSRIGQGYDRPQRRTVNVDEDDWLAERFEAHRTHLAAVAYRMLGSRSEADDAVQEAWLRLSRAGTGGVENLAGWLTTIVARVCLNMLQSRKSRREEPIGADTPGRVASRKDGLDPEHEALLADSVGLALLVVLDMLGPAERVAFVLHDMFDVPYDEIAPIVGRSAVATRQLASRARRRVRGVAPVADADVARQREVVDAFLAASRGGDFDALLVVLDPDVVLRADSAAVSAGASSEVRGAAAVAATFAGRARAAQPALVDGAAAAVWAPGGKPRVVFGFTVTRGKIVEISLLADPDHLRQLDLTVLGG